MKAERPKYKSLLDAHLADQQRRNRDDVAELQRLVASGDLLRPVMEARRG